MSLLESNQDDLDQDLQFEYGVDLDSSRREQHSSRDDTLDVFAAYEADTAPFYNEPASPASLHSSDSALEDLEWEEARPGEVHALLEEEDAAPEAAPAFSNSKNPQGVEQAGFTKKHHFPDADAPLMASEALEPPELLGASANPAHRLRAASSGSGHSALSAPPEPLPGSVTPTLLAQEPTHTPWEAPSLPRAISPLPAARRSYEYAQDAHGVPPSGNDGADREWHTPPRRARSSSTWSEDNSPFQSNLIISPPRQEVHAAGTETPPALGSPFEASQPFAEAAEDPSKPRSEHEEGWRSLTRSVVSSVLNEEEEKENPALDPSVNQGSMRRSRIRSEGDASQPQQSSLDSSDAYPFHRLSRQVALEVGEARSVVSYATAPPFARHRSPHSPQLPPSPSTAKTAAVGYKRSGFRSGSSGRSSLSEEWRRRYTVPSISEFSGASLESAAKSIEEKISKELQHLQGPHTSVQMRITLTGSSALASSNTTTRSFITPNMSPPTLHSPAGSSMSSSNGTRVSLPLSPPSNQEPSATAPSTSQPLLPHNQGEGRAKFTPSASEFVPSTKGQVAPAPPLPHVPSPGMPPLPTGPPPPQPPLPPTPYPSQYYASYSYHVSNQPHHYYPHHDPSKPIPYGLLYGRISGMAPVTKPPTAHSRFPQPPLPSEPPPKQTLPWAAVRRMTDYSLTIRPLFPLHISFR